VHYILSHHMLMAYATGRYGPDVRPRTRHAVADREAKCRGANFKKNPSDI